MDCDTHLVFNEITEGYYTLSISGCGYLWETEVYIDGHSDYLFVLCPDGTNLGCCPLGCGMSNGEYDGSFICDGCSMFLSSGEAKGNLTMTTPSKLHVEILSRQELLVGSK